MVFLLFISKRRTFTVLFVGFLAFSLDWNSSRPLLSNLCQWVPRDITACRCPSRVTPWKIETSPISPLSPPLQMERRGSLIVISAPQTWGDQTPPCFLGGFCWQGKNEINCRLANKNQTLIWLSHAAWVSVQHLVLPNKFGDCWLILVVSSLTVHTYTGRWWWYLMRGFNWENLVRVFLSVGGGCQEKNWLIWTRSYWRDPPHWRTMVINHWAMIINQRQKSSKLSLW